MTRILVTAPFLIPPTHISWMLMNEVVKYAKSKGIEVEFLQGPMATRVPYSYSAPRANVICYDEKTEILTDRGFIPFSDLQYGDLVATLNPANEIEYHYPLAIQRYRYRGRMIRIREKSVDLLVTPDHQVYCAPRERCFRRISVLDVLEYLQGRKTRYVRFRRGGVKWNCTTLQDFVLPSVEGSPIKGVFQPINYSFPIETWLKFFGWYLGEGCCRYREKKSWNSYEVYLTQKRYKEEVKSLLEQMGLKYYYSVDKKTGAWKFEIKSKQLYSYLSQFGRSKERYVPSYVKNLDSRLLRVLFETLVKAEGSVKVRERGTEYRFYTYSKRLADDVQEIAIKLGLSATLSTTKRGEFIVIATTRDEVWIMNDNLSFEEYDGYVYDVTVPNHVIMVRRNGKAVWCGNCYAGHGSTDALIGETIVPPWMMDKYLAPIVKDKIVVAVPCCLSASELGPACIRAGAKAYIGAVDSMYAGFGNEDHDYLKDWIDHHMVLYKALLDGETVGEAVSRYRERGQYYIRLYQANPRWADSDYHIHAFSENIRVITVLGDPTARVVPSRGGYELLAMALPLAVAIPGIPPLKKSQSSYVTHQELKFEIPKEVYPMLSFFAPLVAVALSPLVSMAVETVKKRVVG